MNGSQEVNFQEESPLQVVNYIATEIRVKVPITSGWVDHIIRNVESEQETEPLTTTLNTLREELKAIIKTAYGTIIYIQAYETGRINVNEIKSGETPEIPIYDGVTSEILLSELRHSPPILVLFSMIKIVRSKIENADRLISKLLADPKHPSILIPVKDNIQNLGEIIHIIKGNLTETSKLLDDGIRYYESSSK